MEKIRAKKSLGQNWLKSETALSAIVDAGDINGEDIVLEIGPGQGALTEKLLFFAGKVIAVEKDQRLIKFLQEKFAREIATKKLNLLEKDILELDTNTLATSHYKLVANIPYYITGQVLRKFLTANKQPKLMVLMLQKEVAERIARNKGKESLLSISVKAYGQPKYIQTVKKEFFSPKPKVDSAILLINNISRDFFTKNKINEEEFFTLVKQGFAQKRKKLSSNLKIPLATLVTGGIDINARAENLSLEDWRKIAKTQNN